MFPFVLPWHYQPIMSFHMEWWAFFLGLVLAAAWLACQARPVISLSRPGLALAGLAGLIALHTLLTDPVYPAQGWLSMLYLVWALLLMVVLGGLAEQQPRDEILVILAWALLAGSAYNVLASLVQASGIHAPLIDAFTSTGFGTLSVGLIGQRNNYADYLAIGLAATLYLQLKNKLPWYAILPLAALLTLGMALSASRSVWLYLAAMLALALVWRYRADNPAGRRLVWYVLSLTAAFQAWQLLIPVIFPVSGVQTANLRILESADEFPVRQAMWEDAWRMFLAHPWLGVGHQNYAWNHLELIRAGTSAFLDQPDRMELYRWTHAHNIVLHLLAEFGLAVLPLLLAMGWWLGRFMVRVVTLEQWFMAAALAVLSLHSLLEYPLWYANFLALFAIMLALADERPLRFAMPLGSLRRLGGLILLLGFALAGFAYLTNHALERAWANARQPVRNPTTNADLGRDLDVAQMNPFLQPITDSMFAQLPIPEGTPRELVEMKLRLNANVIRFGGDATPYFHHTTLLWLAGRHQEAEAWLHQAERLFPGQFEPYLAIVENSFSARPGMAAFLDMTRRVKANRQPRRQE